MRHPCALRDYDRPTARPVHACVRALAAARAMTWAAASDNSLLLTLSNGATVQFDGFWERDECMSLLQACGRYLKHPITVEEMAEVQAAADGAGGVDCRN